MAKSISQAQADALSEGFFNDLGTARTGPGLKATKTTSALILLAANLVTQAQENLNKSDRVATGALSESLKVLNPERVGGAIQVDVEALFYYKFVDAGVRGRKSGSSSKGYSYKDKMPPIDVIKKWLTKEGLKAKTKTGGKPITKREARRQKIKDKTNGLAFAVAKSIFNRGLKRTDFFTSAVKSTEDKADSVFSKAFKIDVINSLPKDISEA